MVDSCQVLIVGAGPVGLTLAAYLNHFGICPRIIDKKQSPTLTSNAIALHTRTLELLNLIGLSATFIEHGRKIMGVKGFTPTAPLFEFDFSKISSSYNFSCTLPQAKTEEILTEHLLKHNIKVERDTTLADFTVNNESVTTRLQSNGQTKELTCEWVIGCDGYHSKVRELLKTPYEGNDMAFRFLMVDGNFKWDQSLDYGYLGLGKDMSVAIFPMLHSSRIIAEVSANEAFKDVEDPTEEIMSTILSQCFPGKISVENTNWKSKFWVHERLAKNYRQGRVLIAGDAAHAHSPAGGQGMNTGMQDAINLAWKLSWVLKGYASEMLLNSYEQERRPVAEQVLKFSGIQTKVALSHNPVVASVRDFLVPHLTKINFIQQKAVATISETAICYAQSPISSGDTLEGIAPGDRVPEIPTTETKEKLLLVDYTGNTSEVLADHPAKKFLTIKTGASTASASPLSKINKGYCVIRPDYYVGFMGEDAEALKQYLLKISQ